MRRSTPGRSACSCRRTGRCSAASAWPRLPPRSRLARARRRRRARLPAAPRHQRPLPAVRRRQAERAAARGKSSAAGSSWSPPCPTPISRRYAALAQRCQAVLEQQFHGDTSAPGFASQSDSLGRLTWMYLRLLVTRQGIQRVLREGAARAPGDPPPVPGTGAPGMSISGLEKRLAELKRRLADPSISDDLRRSLEGQADLLEQRVARRGEADQKLAFLDAELARIEEQVELIREQAVLSTDPDHLSQRIDEISATLGIDRRVDRRSAEDDRRDGRPDCRAAAAGRADARPRAELTDTPTPTCRSPPGPPRCATCSDPDRSPSSCSTATSSTSSRTAIASSR